MTLFLEPLQLSFKMKKILLLLLAAVGITTISDAQVMFGPMAGLNISIVSTSVDEGDAPEATSGIGFFIGGMADISVSDKFSVRPELHFSVRGVTDDSGEEDVKASDYFLEIPILASIKPSENFNIHVGPQIGLLIGGKATFGDEDITGSDYTEGRNGFELGLAAGASYETDGGLGIGFRYVRGLTSLYEDTDGFTANYNVLQLFASYTLGK